METSVRESDLTKNDITQSSNNGSSSDMSSANIAMKILVTNGIAGTIIGRSGSTISELQSLSGSRIRLSSAGDCFPGTNERVCLIDGDIERVKAGIQLILQRFILTVDDDDDDEDDEDEEDEDDMMVSPANDLSPTFQLRLLIPSTACGLLIGRNGRHIRSIAANSQTKTQLSQQEEISSIATSERVLSVQGGKENILQCVTLLIDCIEKEIDELGGVDNSVWRYLNMTTSYTRASAAALSGAVGRNSSLGGRVISPVLQDLALVQGSGLLNSQTAQGQVLGGQLSTSLGQDPLGALNRLQGAQNGNIDYVSLPTSPASQASISYAASQMQRSSANQLFKVEESPQVSDPSTASDSLHTVTLAIPDPLVGAIIGQNGSILTQLQLCSQTRIQISQRGEHVPGTNHRLVTVTGNTKEKCDAAQFWIEQRMTMSQNVPGGQMRNNQGRGGRGRGRGGGRGVQ